MSSEEFDSVVNARWQMQRGGRWCPVTSMYIGPRLTKNPLQAASAVVFTGEEVGAWLATEVFPGEIVARQPGCAPEWLDWTVVARYRKAPQRAPQRR